MTVYLNSEQVLASDFTKQQNKKAIAVYLNSKELVHFGYGEQHKTHRIQIVYYNIKWPLKSSLFKGTILIHHLSLSPNLPGVMPEVEILFLLLNNLL